MKTRTTILVLVGAAVSMGCAVATDPQFLPQEEVRFSRTTSAHVDVGSMRSTDELVTVLPRVLGRQGYFIIDTKRRSTDGIQFVTDWRVRPIFEEEAFSGAQQARTRLIVDARRRDTRYYVTVYAESYLEDENGAWRESGRSRAMQKHLDELSTAMALEVR